MKRLAPKKALADPIIKPPRRPLEKLLAIMVDPEDLKKACWWPRIAQEGLLEAKISKRNRFGAILGSILGGCFGIVSLPKSGPNVGLFLVSFFAPFLSKKVGQIDPESLQHGTRRPEKVPR